jgi:lipopolysaccharide transport system permease protein
VISGLHVFILSSIPLVAMMVWNHVYPGWRLILLPIVLLQCAALSLGVGLIVASLSIKNKDWNRFLGLVLYVGLFVSPVIYSPEMIPKAGRYMPFFNPMVGTLLAFRSCIISDFPFPTLPWMCSILFTAICLFIGLEFFKRKQVELVDKI